MADQEKVLAAFEQVNEAVATLRSEYKETCDSIQTLESNIVNLKKMHAPFEDIKQGILEYIDNRGLVYAEDKIKTALRSFAVNRMNGGFRSEEDAGKPMRLEVLDKAVESPAGALEVAQLLTPEKNQFNDMVLYAICTDAVKALLSRVMATMTPADFGYDQIHPDKVGPTRAQMKLQVIQWQQQIEAHKDRCAELKSQLNQLGVIV